jgi:hypothetical protein
VVLTRVPVVAQADTIAQRITVTNNPRFVFMIGTPSYQIRILVLGQRVDPGNLFFHDLPSFHQPIQTERFADAQHAIACGGVNSF